MEKNINVNNSNIVASNGSQVSTGFFNFQGYCFIDFLSKFFRKRDVVDLPAGVFILSVISNENGSVVNLSNGESIKSESKRVSTTKTQIIFG